MQGLPCVKRNQTCLCLWLIASEGNWVEVLVGCRTPCAHMQGNPCVEEPDYRLIVIYNISSLKILDLHMVTEAERQKARLLIGGETEVRVLLVAEVNALRRAL